MGNHFGEVVFWFGKGGFWEGRGGSTCLSMGRVPLAQQSCDGAEMHPRCPWHIKHDEMGGEGGQEMKSGKGKEEIKWEITESVFPKRQTKVSDPTLMCVCVFAKL